MVGLPFDRCVSNHVRGYNWHLNRPLKKKKWQYMTSNPVALFHLGSCDDIQLMLECSLWLQKATSRNWLLRCLRLQLFPAHFFRVSSFELHFDIYNPQHLNLLYLGAMMSLSAFVIPVLFDTNASPEHIVRQWVRLYHYGHIYLPALCIATCGIYGISARQCARSGRKWRAYGYAALSTISMVPFTWVIMTPTNTTLFELDNSNSATDLAYVKGLLVKWAWMHVTRSLSPLLGAYLGFAYLIQEQRL